MARNLRRRHVGPRQHLVDIVDKLGERLGLAITGLRQLNTKIGANVARVPTQHYDAVGEQDGFFNVVRDQEDGLGGHGLVGPELQQFTAQVFGGEHVEGRKRLIHKENFRFDNEGAGKADTLLHAA